MENFIFCAVRGINPYETPNGAITLVMNFVSSYFVISPVTLGHKTLYEVSKYLFYGYLFYIFSLLKYVFKTKTLRLKCLKNLTTGAAKIF